MAKIKVIPDEAIEALLPEKTLIRVIATTLDGARHSVEVVNPLGHPDNPMQDRHIEEKFMALADRFSAGTLPNCARPLVACARCGGGGRSHSTVGHKPSRQLTP